MLYIIIAIHNIAKYNKTKNYYTYIYIYSVNGLLFCDKYNVIIIIDIALIFDHNNEWESKNGQFPPTSVRKKKM